MDVVEDIKSRLDVADLVGEYVPLKPAGSGSFKGLCPFHHERSPSFFVNRPRQSWHCFGCDQGGDVISFVMQIEGMAFPEALELLAQKVGVTLPAFERKDTTDRQRLYEVNALASSFFRAMLLQSPDAEQARVYAASRAIDDLTGDEWKIGYAPAEWSAMTDALKARGVTEDELIRAGLALARDRESGQATRGVYDRFRNRLMFTICDAHGHVVGFTGRLLEKDSKEAKYVNTPETAVYKKSLILYGLDKAKGDIRREDLAVIVEGNMDVVSSHRAGITNVVASSGTALTREQLLLLKRYTMNLAIAFDGDSAGKAATVRGLDLARQMDFSVRIITLPPDAGKDPDDAVRKDPALWRQAIHDAVGIVEWLYRTAFVGRSARRPEEKKMIARDVLPELKRISDPVERESWLKRLSEDLDVSVTSLNEALRSVPFAPTAQPQDVSPMQSPRTRDESSVSRDSVVDRLRALIVLQPQLLDLAKTRLREYTPVLDVPEEERAYYLMFADREFEDQSPDTLRVECERTLKTFLDRAVTIHRDELARQMRDAELAGDAAAIQDLMEAFARLQTYR